MTAQRDAAASSKAPVVVQQTSSALLCVKSRTTTGPTIGTPPRYTPPYSVPPPTAAPAPTCPNEKSSVMLQSMPCRCSRLQASTPSQVEASLM